MDPDADHPALIAWDLVDGAYVEVGRGTGVEEVTLTAPYPVAITPADLIA